jgi:hypothetical protein
MSISRAKSRTTLTCSAESMSLLGVKWSQTRATLSLSKDLLHAHAPDGLDGERRGDIVGQDQGHAALDDLSVRGDGLVRAPLQYFLG